MGIALGLLIELLWLVPVAVLVLLLQRRAAFLRKTRWAIPLGTMVGAVYAASVALLVGPMVQLATVPLLPLAMTAGTVAGAIPLYERPNLHARSRTTGFCLVAVVVIWGSFFAVSSTLVKSESLHVVVVKVNPGSRGLAWAENDGSPFLNHAEMEATEQAAKPVWSGELIPVSSYNVGEGANATAILVMKRDVSEDVRLPRPKRGVVIYVQREDGSWQGADTNVAASVLLLSPNRDSGFTRIEIQGLWGSTSTEVGVSHR